MMMYKIGTLVGILFVILAIKGLENRASRKYKERLEKEELERRKRYKI